LTFSILTFDLFCFLIPITKKFIIIIIRTEISIQSNKNKIDIEDLRVKRSDLSAVIEQEEGQKREVEDKIKALKEKLEVLEKSLENKNAMKMKYDKTIEDTEGAFAKVIFRFHLLYIFFFQKTLYF